MGTRKGLRQVITCFPLAASILVLTGGALARPWQPGIGEEGNVILIENDHARLILSKDGQTRAFLDKKTGTDYLDHSIPVHFMTARRGNVEYGSSGLVRAGNLITVEFGGSGIVASVRIGAKRAYFTIEVVSVNQNTLDELIIVDLPLTISERVARVQEKREHSETINVGRNDNFGVSVMSVNLNTESKTVRYEPAAFRSTCYPRFGLEGAKAAIVAGPPDQILEIIGQIELELGMAHPTLGGQWGKISEEVKKSYLFVDFTEENIERAIALARAGGFGQILNYRSVWAVSSGKYEVNRKNFPHGLEGLKGVMHRIHEAGLKGGVHMMSGGISKNDGYVTPVPDPRLAKDDMRVLAADISEAATTLPLTTSPEGLPAQELYAESGMSLVIDNEIITYQGMRTHPPYALTGCTRGAYGTQAAPQLKGARVYHLAQKWGLFAVDGNSDMLEEVAQNVADIVNHCGFDMIYFDGLDGVEVNGPFFYYVGKMVNETTRRFQREVLVQGSNLAHINWHNFSRLYTIDFVALDPKRWVDHHCRQRMANARNNLMPAELGWHGFFLEGNSSESTTPDVIEYVLAKTIGWEVPWSLETRMQTLEGHGRTDEILALSKVYEDLRLNNYFSHRVRKVLRTPKQDFKLIRDSSGRWQIHPIRYGPARLLVSRGEAGGFWALNNEYGDQALKVRVKARPSRAGFGHGENIVLARGDGSGLWMGDTAGSDFTLSITHSAEQVKVGAGSLKLTAENRASESSSWAAQTLVFEQPLDLRRNRALGVWVYGDGSGAAFNIRLKSGGFSRDHLVKLDFRGWRYCEWAEPAGGEILDYPLPGYPLRSLRSFNYRKVGSITLFITDVSPHSRVTAYLGRVEALRERPSTLKNPAIVVNSERIVFPVTLENNHYLEYWGNGEVTVYDQNGHTIERTRPQGKPPTVRAGSNRVAYRSESPSGEAEQARVEIITIGQAVPNS